MRHGWATGLALIFFAASAGADTPPSVWSRARDPEAALAYDVHEQVQRRLAVLRDGSERIDERDLRAVLPILQHAQAETSKSALLRFDLAFVYYELKDYTRAAAIYRSAIKDFPDHPSTERAWLLLAFACGHFGDNACERDSYTKVLELETVEVLRATPSLNLAETQMHLGNLREAVEGYREVVRIAGREASREVAPLAFWGLAIALDRSGDRVEAEKAARLAINVEKSMGSDFLHDPQTSFFVPIYEIHWYEALGFVAQARGATTSREALTFWSMAEAAYGKFVKAAEPKNDRWLPIAKARFTQVQAERKRAEKSAAREPTPPFHGEDGDLHL